MVFYKINIVPKSEVTSADKCCQVNPLGIDNTTVLRGIAAIEIMLGHIGIYTDALPLFPFRKAGIFFTGLFFLISGYANALNLTEKEGYIKKYLPARMCGLLLPAYIAFFIGLLENAWWAKDIKFVYKAIAPAQIFSGINWFIWELMGMYIVTYLLARLFTLKKSWYYLVAISLIFVGVAYFSGMDETWYGSSLCYGFGVSYYYLKDKIGEIIKKHPLLTGISLLIMLLLALAGFVIFGAQSFMGNVVCRNIMAVIFCALVILVLHYLTIGNGVSRFLGKISFEIYLFHNLFLGFLGFYIKNQLLMSILVIACTIVFSFLYNNIYNSVIKKIKNNKKHI